MASATDAARQRACATFLRYQFGAHDLPVANLEKIAQLVLDAFVVAGEEEDGDPVVRVWLDKLAPDQQQQQQPRAATTTPATTSTEDDILNLGDDDDT